MTDKLIFLAILAFVFPVCALAAPTGSQPMVAAHGWNGDFQAHTFVAVRSRIGSILAMHRQQSQPDYDQKAKQAKKAAEQGDRQAQATLGMLYSMGKGVHQDDVKAAMWVMLAGDGGNPLASAYLKVLEMDMSTKQISRAKKMADTWRSQHPDTSMAVDSDLRNNEKH